METIIHMTGPGNSNIIWQMAIGTHDKTSVRSVMISIKMDNLTSCIYTGISSAGTLKFNFLISYDGKCSFKLS